MLLYKKGIRVVPFLYKFWPVILCIRIIVLREEQKNRVKLGDDTYGEVKMPSNDSLWASFPRLSAFICQDTFYTKPLYSYKECVFISAQVFLYPLFLILSAEVK